MCLFIFTMMMKLVGMTVSLFREMYVICMRVSEHCSYQINSAFPPVRQQVNLLPLWCNSVLF